VRLADPVAPMNLYSFNDTLQTRLTGGSSQRLVTTYVFPGVPSPCCP